jgi:HlyD family type I secretion membrane fusion protein
MVPTNPVPAITIGLAVILVGLGGLAAWAAFADISGAVVASGTVKVISNRKQVQTSEGGIVRDITVRDGAKVNAGDVLVRLDDTNARSSLSIVQANYDLVRATVARLRAERRRADSITYPEDLVAPEVLEGQRQSFEARRNELAGQIEIQRERIGQLEEEIAGLTIQSAAKGEQSEVVAREHASVRDLLEKGLVPRTRLLELQREGLRLKGDKAEVDASIARDKRLIAEARLDILQLGKTFDKEVNDELGVRETEMFGLAERVAAAQHGLDQTVIRATESGVVVGLGIHTVGGVIQPGATLLEIVPTGDNLIIEAKIRPVDMDTVTVGMDVEVVFPAFSQRKVPRISGRIDYVSADALTDDTAGASYYIAQVTLLDGEIEKLGAFNLLPGMPAEIFVKTGERSPLAYLTQPLRDSMSRAWREP